MPSNPPRFDLSDPDIKSPIIAVGYRGSKTVFFRAPADLLDRLKQLEPSRAVRIDDDGTLLANGKVEIAKGITANIPCGGIIHLSPLNVWVDVWAA